MLLYKGKPSKTLQPQRSGRKPGYALAVILIQFFFQQRPQTGLHIGYTNASHRIKAAHCPCWTPECTVDFTGSRHFAYPAFNDVIPSLAPTDESGFAPDDLVKAVGKHDEMSAFARPGLQ